MTVASDLNNLLRPRIAKKYQAAERTRRRMGAAAMAKYPPTSAQFRKLGLMVNVWEKIASRVRRKKSLKVAYFQTSPVGFMWNKLSPGIKILQGKGRRGEFSARQFRLLNTEFRRWLKRQAPQYRTKAMRTGIGAQFG
jgi:hypothetical protein